MYFSYGAFYFFIDILTNPKRALFIVNLGNILMLRVRQHYIYRLPDVKSMPFLVFTSALLCNDGV